MTHSGFRVGLVVPRFAPFRGGVETYVASAAAALAARGVDVTVITQAPRAAELPRQDERDGYVVERHHLPVSDVFDVPSLSAVRAAARKGRFDVVWVHSYHTPLAWLVAEGATAPLAFTPHYHGVGHTTVRQTLHRAYRLAGKRLMAASDRIVVNTEDEAALLLRDFPDQVNPETIAVIPPIVTDPTRGRAAAPSGSPLVLTVARQEPYKRTDLLVRAIAECRRRAVPVRLVVVGEGAGLPGLRDLAAQLGAQDVVTFTGSVDDQTLAQWWAAASIYATASEQESYGLGLAEALLAGIPVVASDINAHRQVIERAGPAVAARTCSDQAVARYAEAVVDLLCVAGTRPERAAMCALPSRDDIAEQLLETFTSLSNRTRQ